jgi:sortase B
MAESNVSNMPSTQKIGKKRRRQLECQNKKQRQSAITHLAIFATACAALLAYNVMPFVSDLIELRREQAYLISYGVEMREINAEYVGTLVIDGTEIDYPVVRGNDNLKYLNTTFYGDENMAGAIFMDYRCVGDYVPHIIIYGHELADFDGNRIMFGGLHDFLDGQYLAEHPEIMFIENGRVSEFEIFSARITDINDPAYFLDFSAPGSFQSFAERNGAPPDAEQIITLSTCVGADNDKRVIVQGTLKNVLPEDV